MDGNNRKFPIKFSSLGIRQFFRRKCNYKTDVSICVKVVCGGGKTANEITQQYVRSSGYFVLYFRDVPWSMDM